MAAYNEADNIVHTFTAIDRLEYPADIEIIVVDDGSTDDTVKILKEIKGPNMKIVEAEHGGKAHALNLGLEQVRTGIFLTIDADTVLHPQAIKRLIARFLPSGGMGIETVRQGDERAFCFRRGPVE